MNIVGVTACTVGIAHTYIAQKKIETAAKKAGHNVKIETQGTIGIENPLTADEIAAAVAAAVAETGAAGPADMGKVMGVLKPRLTGRADMTEVSKQVKAALSK